MPAVYGRGDVKFCVPPRGMGVLCQSHGGRAPQGWLQSPMTFVSDFVVPKHAILMMFESNAACVSASDSETSERRTYPPAWFKAGQPIFKG